VADPRVTAIEEALSYEGDYAPTANVRDAGKAALASLDADLADRQRWLAWSDGQYPDESPGDVISAEPDGTIVLDDGITTWNPRRAAAFFAARAADRQQLRDALRQERVERHVQNLDMALALAESDELYAEILRPHFKRIVAALAASAETEKEPT
jgi:hypothetical protein